MPVTDIYSMVDLAYQDLGTPAQERFAVQHFIDALSDKFDRWYLRREKPSTLDVALSLARELESLGLLDSSNSLRRADTKVRAIETEQTQLQTEVDGFKHKINEQQQQLEAQANIIATTGSPQERVGILVLWRMWTLEETTPQIQSKTGIYPAFGKREECVPKGPGRCMSNHLQGLKVNDTVVSSCDGTMTYCPIRNPGHMDVMLLVLLDSVSSFGWWTRVQ